MHTADLIENTNRARRALNEIAEPLEHAIAPRVYRTRNGTPYLAEPGVAVVARPQVHLDNLAPFLRSFEDPEFVDYTRDPVQLEPGATLAKFAGQLCYLSLGEKRTRNIDGARYFDNIRVQGHGSILEHASYSLLLYGIGRDVTHEIVRHRAGFGFSQVSQRYVGPERLRFVRGPEYAQDADLRALFEAGIDASAATYRERIEALREKLPKGKGTANRKRLQQAARRCLPNEAEAPILVTGNARAWRHAIAARANPHADAPIREAFFRAFLLLCDLEPLLFGDFSIEQLEDGSRGVTSSTPKV